MAKRVILNPNEDEDIIYQVNKGGVITDALVLKGDTGRLQVLEGFDADGGAGLATATVAGLVSKEIVAGTFTGAMSGGFSTNPTDQTYSYMRLGNMVIISVNNAQTGTSNATTNPVISGVPEAIRPITSNALANLSILDQNLYKSGFAILRPDGTIELSLSLGNNSFAATQAKGLPANVALVFFLRD